MVDISFFFVNVKGFYFFGRGDERRAAETHVYLTFQITVGYNRIVLKLQGNRIRPTLLRYHQFRSLVRMRVSSEGGGDVAY